MNPRISLLLGLLIAVTLNVPFTYGQETRDSMEDLAAEASATQTIKLRKGWNYVSLTLHPVDLDIRSILEPILEHVVMVEDDAGRMFVPHDGVAQFATWDLRHAYKVNVSEDVVLEVEGLALDEDQMSVHLEVGWNLVPMYIAEGLSISEAFDSLGDGLVLVRSAAGEVYYPEGEISDLTEITPGEGYLVYARESTRLQFRSPTGGTTPLPDPIAPRPSNPIKDEGDGPADDDPADENGIPGQDDDGAGDGYEDDNQNRGDEGKSGSDDLGDGDTDPSDRSDGSADDSDGEGDKDNDWTNDPVDYADADTTVNTMAEALAIEGLSVGQVVQVLGYYEAGDNGGGIFDVTDDGCAPDGATCYVPKEHQADSAPSRIRSNYSGRVAHQNIVFGSVRLYYNEKDYLTDLHLHGHQMHLKGAPSPLIDHATGRLSLTNEVRHLPNDRGNGSWLLEYRYASEPIRLKRRDVEHINLRWLGARPSPDFDATDHIAWAINVAADRYEGNGTFSDMVVDDMYYYAGQIIHRDGVRLRGAQEDERDGQGFKVLDDSAILMFREKYLDSGHALWLPRSLRSYYQNDRTIWVRPQPNARLVSVKDFELHGNVEGNMSVFEHADQFPSSNDHYENQVSHLLQNTQYWNAYSTGSGASRDLHILLDNVHFHDFGGNIINTQGEPYFDGSRKVRVGNSARNHVFYDVRTRDGWMDDIEVYGYAWGAPFIVYDGKFRDLKIKDLVLKTPIGREIDYPMQIRGSDWSRGDAANNRGVYIEDFEIDAAGLEPYGAIIFMEGKHLDMKNGVIRTQRRNSVDLFYHRGGGASSANISIDNVDVYHRGSTGGFYLTPHVPAGASLTLKNIHVHYESTDKASRWIKVNSRAIGEPQRLFFGNISVGKRSRMIFQVSGANPASVGTEVYATGDFSNTDRLIQDVGKGNGLINFYFSDCVIDASRLTNAEREIAHFSNCTDASTGLPSEQWSPAVKPWPEDVVQ